MDSTSQANISVGQRPSTLIIITNVNMYNILVTNVKVQIMEALCVLYHFLFV